MNPLAPAMPPKSAPDDGGTMVYTVDLGDGRVAEIEGPKGATPEQLHATAASSGLLKPEGSTAGQGADAASTDDPVAVTRLAPGDEAIVRKYIENGDAAGARAFAASKGVQFRNADQLVDAYQKTGKINPDSVYQFDKVETGKPDAFARGVMDTVSVGTLPKVGAVIAGTESALTGGDFGDAYNHMLDANNATVGADEQDHPWMRLSGQLLGGLAVPTGLEGVGLKAGSEVLRMGGSMSEARAAARIAVLRRSAASGAAYGAAHGAGSSDTLRDAAANGIEQGVAGAGGGLAGTAVSPIISRGVNAGARLVNRAGVHLNDFLSVFTHEGAQDRAASLLENAASEPVSDIISRIESAPDSISGASPTLAEVAGDAGLAGLQRGHANTDLATQSAISQRNAENALARSKTASAILDEGVSPQALQDEAQSRLAAGEAQTARGQADARSASDARIAGETAAAHEARSAAGEGLAGATDRIGETADRAATGSAARDTFETAYDAAKQKTRDAYGAEPLNRTQPIEVPRSLFQSFVRAADDFYGEGGGEMAAPLKAIINDLAEPKTTTRTITNIDRRLADFAGAARMGGRKSEAAFAERLRGDLGSFVHETAPEDYRAALKVAKAARADQGTRFETGDIAKTFARDRFGNPVVGDTTIPSRLARPGAPGGDTADRLIGAVGHDKAETFVRQELRRAIDEGGVDTAAKANAITTRYGEMAKRFPGLRRDLDALKSHAAALDEAEAGAATASRAKPTEDEQAAMKARSALHEAVLASPLARLTDAATDPGSFVAGLMRRDDDGRQLGALFSTIRKNGEAVSGLRRAIGDYIINAGKGANFTAAGEQIPSISKTQQAIATTLRRAGSILTPQQKIVLKGVARELQNANFAATASKPAGSETSLNKTFTEVMSMVPGVKASMLNKVIGLLGNGAEVKQLLTRAILEPDFAATLLKRPTPAHWIQVRERMIGQRAAAIGSTSQSGRLLSAVNDNVSRAAAQETPDDKGRVNGDSRDHRQ